MNETKTMWTRQVPEVWEELKTKGTYRVKEEYIRRKNDTIADYYLELYTWYTKEARKYMEIPAALLYPIWLSMDQANMLQSVENTVILEVEVPGDQYLICNMELWGYRVNYWYAPLGAEDHERHRQELLRYGIHDEDELISSPKGNFYPALRRKITDSWERVFTVPPNKEPEAAVTVWELRREWVKEVTFCDKDKGRIFDHVDGTK